MIFIFFIYRSTTLVVMFSVIDWIESIRLSLCFWSPHYQTKVVSYLFFFSSLMMLVPVLQMKTTKIHKKLALGQID